MRFVGYLLTALSKRTLLSKNGSPNQWKVTVCRVRNLPIAAETIVLDVRGQDRVVSKSFSSSQTNSMEFKSSTRISSAVSASPLSPSERQIGESFEFFVEHESAVLHVETRQGGISENGVLVGQWIVPLIDIPVEPRRCRHNGNLKVDSSRQIEGWFPFRDYRFRQEGSCGSTAKVAWEVSEVDEEIRSMSQYFKCIDTAKTTRHVARPARKKQRFRPNWFCTRFARATPLRPDHTVT